MANFLITLYNTVIGKSPNGDAYRTTQSPDKYVNDIAALNTTNQLNLTRADSLRKAQDTVLDNLGTTPGK
jgi:hypothetical protein